MNIAIIGGSGHYNFVFEALALRPELRLCAVAPADGDEDISGLLAACRAHGLTPQRHDSAAALLDAHPEIELAAVNPWFSRAADVSIACLKRGLHVFSEKPLATRLDKLDELENVWHESGRGLGGMFNLRYCGWFKTVQRAIAEGKIGVVRQIQGRKSYKMGNRPEFYRHRETFGGVIPWVGIHALDWATQIGGACVYSAALTNADYNRGHGDMEVTSAVLMELQNGVIATVTADFLRPDGAPRHDDDRLRVTGTAGTLYAYDGQVWLEDAAGLPHRFARCNPTPRRLGATAVRFPLRFARCNPTLQRLRALRVWTLDRVGNIAIQPDPPEHKLDSGGSFRVPE